MAPNGAVCDCSLSFGIHKNQRIDNNDTRINVIGPLRFQIT